MIIGIGLDIVELARIDAAWRRFGDRFVRRILTPRERALLPDRPTRYLASRFAAKEAASKALGTGISQGVSFHGLEVRSLPSGKPELVFLGAALDLSRRLGVTQAHLSLSDSLEMAAAVVVLET